MAEWKGDDIEEESVVEPEEGSDDAVAKIKKLQEELKVCRGEKQENMDGWQRAKADYVNSLKRFDEEKKAERERGVEQAVERLLPAFDALERAKEHGDIPEGFSGIVKQLESGFAALGLEPVGVVGEMFDPALHEALGQDTVEAADEDGKVTAVLEKGWKRADVLIRPAKVRVASAAIKA